MSDENPASAALRAFQDKEQDAKQRLARCFVAFAVTPHAPETEREGEKVKTGGYLIFGTNAGYGMFRAPNFNACYVGEPESQVQEAGEILRDTQTDFADWLSDDDVHAGMARKVITQYNRYVLEDKDEPRAFAVEMFFVDDMNYLHWCGFDGSYGVMDIKSARRRVVVRGCYDEKLNRELKRLLRERFLKQVPSKESVAAAEKDIKKLMKLKLVRSFPVTL